ncbi:hypothetical protein I316_06369 [Kwoniella heveanensis BCC8398]|uniref:Defect at low temperature protein 1 n=1 Tax=Kwoniella heveanensis BCC8398 TaxID=1296120 RepID=A0A1B9GLV9_9TREE|nr:hypothetical protein I316_06369 [Kwoniella heveanensis BCC8398]
MDHRSHSPLLYSSPHLTPPFAAGSGSGSGYGSGHGSGSGTQASSTPDPYSRMNTTTTTTTPHSYPPLLPIDNTSTPTSTLQRFQPTPTPTRSRSKSNPRGSKNRYRRKRRRCMPTARGFRSFLYHTSFYLFVAIIATLLVGSAWGLGEQSWRTGNQKSWNLIVLVAAYVVLKILKTMPKPYMPTKQVDLPKKVASHIATEYSRTAVIAHISQATTGQQEGWGRPGTKWEDKHFRSYILSTLPIMRQALCPNPPTSTSTSTAPPSPLSLQPLLEATDPSKIGDKGALRLFVNSYAKIIENARYGRKEPTQADAEATEKVVQVVLLTLEVKSRREKNREKGV